MAFKMKGSPMKRNFNLGSSPIKQGWIPPSEEDYEAVQMFDEPDSDYEARLKIIAAEGKLPGYMDDPRSLDEINEDEVVKEMEKDTMEPKTPMQQSIRDLDPGDLWEPRSRDKMDHPHSIHHMGPKEKARPDRSKLDEDQFIDAIEGAMIGSATPMKSPLEQGMIMPYNPDSGLTREEWNKKQREGTRQMIDQVKRIRENRGKFDKDKGEKRDKAAPSPMKDTQYFTVRDMGPKGKMNKVVKHNRKHDANPNWGEKHDGPLGKEEEKDKKPSPTKHTNPSGHSHIGTKTYYHGLPKEKEKEERTEPRYPKKKKSPTKHLGEATHPTGAIDAHEGHMSRKMTKKIKTKKD